MPWLILILICLVFGAISDTFFTVRNIVNILEQNCYVFIAAMGIALIMMSGEMDLSVGYEMSLIGVVCGLLLGKLNVPIPVVLLTAVIMGVVLTIINILLAHFMHLSLLMVSVGTMSIYQGISFTVSNSQVFSHLPESFKFLGQGNVGPIPFPIILTVICFLGVNFFLSRTYWGRYVYALGGNKEACHLSGINVLGMKLLIGIIAGVMIGLATAVLVARLGTAQSTSGPGTEITVISGVLVGGVSIRGGEGKLSGVIAGILIMSVVGNGMQMAGLGIYAQFIVKGAIMIFAISIDALQMYARTNRARRLKVGA